MTNKVNEVPNPVDLQKGEVNEVERALDELKEAISKSLGKITCVNDANKLTSKLMDVRKSAQNLVNALKAEKKPFFKIREEGHFEGSPPTKQTDAKIEEFIKDYKRNNRENTSIWKDVSELPRHLDGAAVFYKRDGQTFIGEAHSFGVIAIYPDSNSEHLNNEDIVKVCLVGDFINSLEQMQKDFQELKRK